MKNKEKQIEEMAKIMRLHICKEKPCKICDCHGLGNKDSELYHCDCYYYADTLYNAGYRKSSKDNIKEYKCYVLLDYDVIEQEYLLEIYDFKDAYFDVKSFKTFSDLVNYYHDKLSKILQIDEEDILQITSNSYSRKFQADDYKKLDEKRLFKGKTI